MKILSILTILLTLMSVGCNRAQTSANQEKAAVPSTPTTEDVQKKIRKKKIANLEQELGKPDYPAKLTLDEKEEILTIDNRVISCESFGVLAVNPKNLVEWRDNYGIKKIVFLDPKHPQGKCSWDMPPKSGS